MQYVVTNDHTPDQAVDQERQILGSSLQEAYGDPAEDAEHQRGQKQVYYRKSQRVPVCEHIVHDGISLDISPLP